MRVGWLKGACWGVEPPHIKAQTLNFCCSEGFADLCGYASKFVRYAGRPSHPKRWASLFSISVHYLVTVQVSRCWANCHNASGFWSRGPKQGCQPGALVMVPIGGSLNAEDDQSGINLMFEFWMRHRWSQWLRQGLLISYQVTCSQVSNACSFRGSDWVLQAFVANLGSDGMSAHLSKPYSCSFMAVRVWSQVLRSEGER